ncbi:MAG: TraR/DksA family transcriptional regulator [Actinobacteria bacterium]|nr:TraR/DksA family transcriptional regulator [Actinomycetota bacterium]
METTVARKRLEEMRDDLDRTIATLQGERPGPAADSGYPQDSADAGATLSEADRTDALLHTARGQRDEVLAALARIDEGTYGQCVDCGDQIRPERLDARPDAARCVSCQAKLAKRRR